MEEPVIIVKLIVFFHRSVSPQTRRRQCNVNNGGTLVRHVSFAVVGVGVGGGLGVGGGGGVGGCWIWGREAAKNQPAKET